MISTHTFMFPFRWDYIAENKEKEDISYSLRTRLSDFDRIFSGCKTLKRTRYVIGENYAKYNEYTYFHTFVRKALFYSGEYDVDKHTVLYYELDGNVGDKFEIEVSYQYKENNIDKTFNTTYSLDFKSVCLHIYNTGVGVLTFNLENNTYKEKEHILHINEFGRRLYPQFISQASGIEATKNTFLAQSIKGSIADINFYEDFTQYKAAIDTRRTFLAPDFIKKVFGYRGNQREGDRSVSFVFSRLHEAKGKIRISQITDDRMFFVSYYENAKLADSMAELKNDEFAERKLFQYQLDNFWYCFIFGDKESATLKNDRKQILDMEFHTYGRWLQYNQKNKDYHGSVFGMSRDSFVCLGGWPDLGIHMKTMYYQMSVLCLVQRASVLRFAYEVSNITQLLNTKGNITPRIKDLYKNYIEFINKIYFREVTSQIQGIEMYHQFQEVMNLAKEVRDLDEEIQELHTYVSMDEQEKLSKVATWFLPAGVVFGMLGSNVLGADNLKLFEQPDWNAIVWILGAVLFSAGVSWLIFKIMNMNRSK